MNNNNNIYKDMCKRIITTIACLFTAFSVVFAAGPQKKIHTIGDATMFEDEADVNTDKRGWVQMLQQYFTDNVSINNRGKSGASSKSRNTLPIRERYTESAALTIVVPRHLRHTKNISANTSRKQRQWE